MLYKCLPIHKLSPRMICFTCTPNFYGTDSAILGQCQMRSKQNIKKVLNMILSQWVAGEISNIHFHVTAITSLRDVFIKRSGFSSGGRNHFYLFWCLGIILWGFFLGYNYEHTFLHVNESWKKL